MSDRSQAVSYWVYDNGVHEFAKVHRLTAPSAITDARPESTLV